MADTFEDYIKILRTRLSKLGRGEGIEAPFPEIDDARGARSIFAGEGYEIGRVVEKPKGRKSKEYCLQIFNPINQRRQQQNA